MRVPAWNPAVRNRDCRGKKRRFALGVVVRIVSGKLAEELFRVFRIVLKLLTASRHRVLIVLPVRIIRDSFVQISPEEHT